MKIQLTKNLQPMKNQALVDIDQMAEIARGRYITIGAGQAMVYGEKEREAEMVSANPDIAPHLVPHIAAEATRYGQSLLDVAATILTMANNWRYLSPTIEAERLYRKDQVRAASTPAQIQAIVQEAMTFFEGV